jgi:hypothetical protein
MLPSYFGVVIFCFFFGVNGIWLAHRLLWRRAPALFWLASTVIVLSIGYLVSTGEAESIARSLWPMGLDEAKSKESQLRSACMEPKMLGTMLVVAPIMVVLVPLMLKEKRTWLRALVNVCFVVLFFGVLISPIPEKLSSLALPDIVQRLPDHCRPA